MSGTKRNSSTNSGNSSGASADPAGLDALRLRIPSFRLEALADLALDRGWITEDQLADCLEAVDTGVSDRDLAALLVERGHLTASQAGELVAQQRNLELGDLIARSAADTPAEAERLANDPSRRFGKFILVEEIGRGGMGVVYKAWQPDLGRWVAVKRLRPDSSAGVARFLREARLAGRVLHPNLVPIHEVGESEGRPYLAMALVEGGSLDGAKLPIRRALEVILQVALATQELHKAGILHRDIKPGNVLVDRQERAYLSDFGLARADEAGPGLSKSGTMIGTPIYAPPEQIRGDRAQVSVRSDVYSLGATLWSLLTGEPPYTGADVVEIGHKVLFEDPPSLRSLRPEINTQIQTLVGKAMRKRPEDRYASAAEFASDVRRYLDGQTLLARPPGPAERALAVLRRHRVLIPAVAACVLLAAAVPWMVAKARKEATEETVDSERRFRDLHSAAQAALSDYVHLPASSPAVARKRGESDAAIRACLAAYPRSIEAHHLRVRHLLRGNSIRDAEKAIEEAAAIDPNHPGILLERTRFQLCDHLSEIDRLASPYLERTAESRAELDRMLAGDAEAVARVRARGGVSPARLELLEGLLALLQGDAEVAAGRLKKYLDEEPADLHANYFASSAWYRAGKLEASLACIDEAIRIDPNPRYFITRATTLAKMNRLEEALAALDKADPREAGTWHKRGAYLNRLGRPKESAKAFDQAIALDPRSGLAHYQRASARRASGDLPGALADYHKAMELGVAAGIVHGDRANVYFELGDSEAGWRDLEAGIRLSTGNAKATFGAEWCRRKMSAASRMNPAEALPLLREIRSKAEDGIVADPKIADNHYWRGASRMVLAEREGRAAAERPWAIADFEAFLKLAPKGEMADKARILLERLRAGSREE